MHVAFCLYKYFPFGGLQRDFFRIAMEVYRRGHKVRVYVQSWEGEKPSNFEIIQIKTHSVTNHGQGKEFYVAVQKHLKMHPVDVVVGFNKMPGLDVYYAADVCYKEKVMQQKHGLLGMLYRLTPRYKHFYQFENATFGRGGCPHLLMISDIEKRYYEKHYGTEGNRFVLLPPGVAPDRKYSESQLDQRKHFRNLNGIKDDQIVLLQLGSDFKRKGVDRSLLAIANLPTNLRERIIFLVVGQDKCEAFNLQAKKLGLSEFQVQFLGGRSDVPEILAASDIFLHPAYHENTGTVIVEALVAGLPIIVSGICGYAHYVQEADCGFALQEPFNQAEMNSALERMVSDSSFREKCVQNAKYFADHEDLYSMIEQAADIITAS